jgi:hypothetical protein
MYEDLRDFAREVDDWLLEGAAKGNVVNHSIYINYDDQSVDAYYFLRMPLKWINVKVNKAIDNG